MINEKVAIIVICMFCLGINVLLIIEALSIRKDIKRVKQVREQARLALLERLMYTPKIETWDESIDKAIDALKENRTLKEQMINTPNCNDCLKYKVCGYSPKWGGRVRWNCPHHAPIKEKENEK